MTDAVPQPLQPIALIGRNVELRPLSDAHHDALCEAVVDGELCRLWYTNIPTPRK